MAIFNLGSINVDHVYQVPHFVRPGETLASTAYQRILGGKGANQSIALARAGASVCHIGALSHADQDFYQQLIDYGVNLDHVEQTDTASGHAIIQVDASAENAIVLFGGANQCIQDTAIDKALQSAAEGDWLLTQNETNAVAITLQKAKQQGLKTAYNPAPICGIEADIDPAWVDLLVVNQTEAAAISGIQDTEQQVAYFAERWKHAEVVLTLGSEGAILICHKGVLQVSSFEVDAVDTTAAGDTFIGFYLAARSRNEDQQDAMLQACASAALAVQREGASTSIPTLDDVDEFLAEVME